MNVSSCYRTVPDYGKYPDKTKISSNFLKYKKDFVSIHDFERMSKAGGISVNTNTIPFVARKWKILTRLKILENLRTCFYKNNPAISCRKVQFPNS